VLFFYNNIPVKHDRFVGGVAAEGWTQRASEKADAADYLRFQTGGLEESVPRAVSSSWRSERNFLRTRGQMGLHKLCGNPISAVGGWPGWG